jgi:predicted nucleotidyltransferase
MHGPSSGFASVRFLDREAVPAAIQAAAARAAACPGVLAIYLFGSFASGVPTPRSDADLLVVITDDADREGVRDCCLEAFRPVPVDLFVWTDSEVTASLSSGRGLPATVLRQTIRLR